MLFRDRQDAAVQLADRLRAVRDPLVLAIPRGGVLLGAALARELGADLDLVLARKLRAPAQPELALGAVAEDGTIYLNHHAHAPDDELQDYLDQERCFQLAEISRRKALFRRVRPPAPIASRSVIVTDDGIATGSTMIAALQAIKAQNPRELIVAVPVAPPERLDAVRERCDAVVCLYAPAHFTAVGQFFQHFEPVDDDQIVTLLQEVPARPALAPGAADAPAAPRPA